MQATNISHIVDIDTLDVKTRELLLKVIAHIDNSHCAQLKELMEAIDKNHREKLKKLVNDKLNNWYLTINY